MLKKILIFAPAIVLVSFLGAYFYDHYQGNPYLHLRGIEVEGSFWDVKYEGGAPPDDPGPRKYRLKAHLKAYELNHEKYIKSAMYRVMALDSSNRIVEEKMLDFSERNKMFACGTNSTVSTEYVFVVNFRYSSRTEKIRLEKDGRTLNQTEIYLPEGY